MKKTGEFIKKHSGKFIIGVILLILSIVTFGLIKSKKKH